ncbi:MAG TPA: hypothetical protein VJW73_21310 [Gemmatimonadaceae bacterium]|nr:hypothetical protein [Gemmatimonadaceae bacterium]
MPIYELVDRLFIPLALAIVLLLGTAAYLIRRSQKIDAWPLRTDEDFRGQAAARAAVAEARRILGRAAWRAVLLVSLLFAGVRLLNDLAGAIRS